MHAGHDTIRFHLPAPPAHTENIIKLTSGELTSKGNVTINGPGSGRLIIDANNASRVFDIDDGVLATDSPTTISGLSIVRGNAAGNSGGGVYSLESLTLKSVVVSGCSAGAGGGIEVFGDATAGTTASVSNSLIAGNSASIFGGALNLLGLKAIAIKKSVVTGNTGSIGGGIYAGIISSGTGIAITGSTINGNSASYGGGLVLNNTSNLPRAKTVVSGTTIAENTSTNANASGGGGVFVRQGNTVITGSTIRNNTAVYNGGGIQTDTSFNSLTISKCTISGNQTTATNATYQGGGGIFIQGSGSATPKPVKITGTTIADNRSASYGGGLRARNGIALTISGTAFTGNRAVNSGGGLWASGFGANKVDVAIGGSKFADNLAGGLGGGVDVFGNGVVSIVSSKVTGDRAFIAGGIYAQSNVSVTIQSVVVSGNFASSQGGGLMIGNTPNFHVTGGAFRGNSAKYGGAIFVFDSTGSISGVTISGNAATVQGGGVFQSAGAVTLQIGKVHANTAPDGADVFGTFTFV